MHERVNIAVYIENVSMSIGTKVITTSYVEQCINLTNILQKNPYFNPNKEPNLTKRKVFF